MASNLGISRKALSGFINQRSNLSAEMAVHIATATNTSPESWMLMQSKLDLWRVLMKKPKVIKQLEAKST
jgi:antitoxin HigA-1